MASIKTLDDLKEAGFNDVQARAILRAKTSEDSASKEDLVFATTQLTKDIETIKADLTKDIETVRADLKRDIKEMELSLKNSMLVRMIGLFVALGAFMTYLKFFRP